MFKKILVPLDGSSLSNRAVPAAYALAGPETEVILLRAIDPVRMAAAINTYEARLFWPDAPGHKRREAADQLAVVRAGLPADLLVETRVIEGNPAESIIDVARDTPADLIVMSTHDYAGLTRWVLGSVTEQVLESAPCPVLVVRGTARFNQMLIALDGSFQSARALAPAMALAAAFHSRVTLMHVVVAPEFNPPRPLAETRAEPGSTWLDRQVSAGEDYLCRVAAENGAARAAYKVVVPAVHAADAIAHYCAGHDMDVVVMATHGYPSLARWGGSSVTERVLHATANSVLVVNPPPAGPWLN